ncbi:hypothetical protein ACLKA7_000651 [Drosophila subpalustris]
MANSTGAIPKLPEKQIEDRGVMLSNVAPSADDANAAAVANNFELPGERKTERDNNSDQAAAIMASAEFHNNDEIPGNACAIVNTLQQDSAASIGALLVSEHAEELQCLKQMEELYLTRKRVADLKLSVMKTEREACELATTPTDRIDLTHIDSLMRSFSGDDDYEVTHWIRDFEDIMNLYSVSDAKRWILAKRLLSGSAKVYITHVAPLTWESLRSELLKVFKEKMTAWDVGKRLEARKIAKNESALQYFVVMCSIAAQADMATSDVVKFIVDGLQDKTGTAASMLYCSSLDEMRDKIVTYDRIRKSSMPVPTRSEDAKPKPSVAAGQQQGASVTRCYNCRQFGHYMKDCSQPKRPDGACFKCWSPSHQYLQCPKRKGATTVAAVQDEERMVACALSVRASICLSDCIAIAIAISSSSLCPALVLLLLLLLRY